MNEKIFEKLPDFDKLLEKKSFKELSDSEKIIILEYLTEEEYENYREIILESREMFRSELTTLKPEPEMKGILLAQFKTKKPPQKSRALSLLTAMLNYRLPVYKLGFAVSIVFIFILFFRPGVFKDTNYITKIDTLFIEKEIKVSVPDTQANQIITASTREHNTEKPDYVNSIEEKSDYETEQNKENIAFNIDILNNSLNNIEAARRMRSGRSINDDSLVLKYLVTVY
jgi:hypothetical protein